MEKSRAERLALGFQKHLENVFKARGAERTRWKEDLTDRLENILQFMIDGCDRSIKQQGAEAEKNLDKVQENLLKAHGKIVDLQQELKVIPEMQSELEGLKREIQWKDDELFRVIEKNSELKQLVEEIEQDLKIPEEYENNEPDDKPRKEERC